MSSFNSRLVSAWTPRALLLAGAVAGEIRAQTLTVCGTPTNECCVITQVNASTEERKSPVAVASAFALTQSAPDGDVGPEAASAFSVGLPMIGEDGRCRPSPNEQFPVSGSGTLSVSVQGALDYYMNIMPMPTGMSGVGGMYGPALVVDMTNSAWAGSSSDIKAYPGNEIPRPDLSTAYVDADFVQPRPGNLSGLYILQVDTAVGEGVVSKFYHYGSPINSGANPQTTAVYQSPAVLPGSFFTTPPNIYTNNLSGAQLWHYVGAGTPYIEIKHVDGTVARFDSFSPSSGWSSYYANQKLWRVTSVRDPYDNQSTFAYSSPSHRLTDISYPNGLTQHWDYAPSWASTFTATTALGANARCIEISYQTTGTTPSEVSARTWGLVFNGTLGASSGLYFGSRLCRTYSPQFSMLADQSSAPSTLSVTTQVTGQVVHEFLYTTTPSVQQKHMVHGGSPFAFTLSTPSGLPDQLINEVTFSSGIAASHSRPMNSEVLTFSYPSSTFPTPWPSGTQMAAVEVARPSTASRHIEYDRKSGRIYSIITRPNNGSAGSLVGRPRAAHAASENSSITGVGGVGVAISDVEPEWMEILNVYDGTCVCQKPIERHITSKRGVTPVTRIYKFQYDVTTKLLTKRSEPSPETGTGPFPDVEWTYSYVQAATTGQYWGAWLPSQEVTPDGTFTYTYSEWLNRADAANWGRIPGTVKREIAGVRLETGLGSQSPSGTPVAWTVHRNLANSPGGLPMQGLIAGLPRRTFDGDGVSTIFEYSTKGFLDSTTVDGSVKTGYSFDGAGNLLQVTANSTSTSLSCVTTYTVMTGVGAVTGISSSSGGITRQAQLFYDRFSHVAVERMSNMSSTSGVKPSRFGGSTSSARDWVENQFVFHHNRLKEVYIDWLPLNEAAGSKPLLMTLYTYDTDGRMIKEQSPNGATTDYTYDGFNTLYRSITTDPSAASVVKSPKTFINEFLEVTGVYQLSGADHLWTIITRNGAGAVVAIKEPITTAPSGYSGSTGGAVHQFSVDVLGRITKAEAYEGSTLLTSREMQHDQLNRQIYQKDLLLGGAGDREVAWTYVAGKASQLDATVSTGIGSTKYTFNSIGLLATVTDAIGNKTTYGYHTNTPFLALVTQSDVDTATPRVTNTGYDVDPFGRVTSIKQEPGSSPLEHKYFYNSLGRVDRYQDPKGAEQRFLGDALGRIVEHARLDGAGAAIVNATEYQEAGATDGRTKMLKYDHLGNLTVTHYDFAGRPFIVQNPGSSTVPTASAPNQSMSLFAVYDSASRLSALYDGDLGKTIFWRDGPGRVIQRQLDGYSEYGTAPTGSKIALWNTKDVIRRDAIGRIVQTDYWATASNALLLGVEQFDHDSLGRVHAERFANIFATNLSSTTSTFTGGSPFRMGVDYGDSATLQNLSTSMSRDAIGRLTQIDWNRAPGTTSLVQLAGYGWVGGLRRSRSVRYGSSGSTPGGSTSFTWDDYGRLTKIEDSVTPSGGSPAVTSWFKYEYDLASNLTKEIYAKVGGRAGDRFAYDDHHRLTTAWMGVDSTTMSASSATLATLATPTGFNATSVHEVLTYGLDGANNRTTSTSLTSSTPSTTNYALQVASPQGPSNRYATVGSVSAPVSFEYDERGNLFFDGQFVYRYDFLNRLQEIWRIVVAGEPLEDGEKVAVINTDVLDDAHEAVKLEVPDIYSRLMREHTNPTFRNRLKATITGGVIRISPTPGGGMPAFRHVSGTLELAAVYVYDAFNRRVLSALVDPNFAETQIHTWDGWRQTVQSKLNTATYVAEPTKQFVWGSQLDEMVAYRALEGSAWKNYYLLHGGQETAAKLVDESGTVVEQYEYDPYGKVTVYDGTGSLATPGNGRAAGSASAKGLPFLWKSIRLDEITGLLQMRNRYYSTGLGRFLTRDPLGVWADATSFGGESAYVGASPLTGTDLFGLQSTPKPNPDLPKGFGDPRPMPWDGKSRNQMSCVMCHWDDRCMSGNLPLGGELFGSPNYLAASKGVALAAALAAVTVGAAAAVATPAVGAAEVMAAPLADTIAVADAAVTSTVAGYEVTAVSAVADGVMSAEVVGLYAAGSGAATQGLPAVAAVLEAEAVSAGASVLSITGHSVGNARLLPILERFASRNGYMYKELECAAVRLVKVLGL